MGSRTFWAKCSRCHHEGYAVKGDKCGWCDDGRMRPFEPVRSEVADFLIDAMRSAQGAGR